ncbi:MAG: DNA methyltransferase [Pseudomonadota bacterium]
MTILGGAWISDQLTARNYYSKGTYSVRCPSGRVVEGPPVGRYWSVSEEAFWNLDADNRIWWGRDGNNMPRLKRFLSEVQDGVVPQTIWGHEEVGNTQEAKKEILGYAKTTNDVFSTPKPERLLKRIIEIASNPGDLVLDSFAGTGTTGAVAHKMGRRWIMVELGDHAETYIVPRLGNVINGNDSGGVTGATGWQGGGGFRYYTLAPSLMEKDRIGNWVISKKYDANMLAHAICKLMGFTYEPSQDEREYWRHGYSTETDFIYVTTQSLTYDALKRISEDVGPKRTLLICCKAYRAKDDAFDNLTLKKIPQAVLKKCEWGRDDYSLKIAELRPAEDSEATTGAEPVEAIVEEAPKPKTRKRKSRKKKRDDQTPDMFAKQVEA